MLELKIQNTAVDLETTASIALSFNCPAFDADSVQRAWSLPFRLPLSPKNRLFFKNLNRLDTRSIADSIAAKVVGDGQDLATGVYAIETATPQMLDGHFENTPLKGLKGLSNQQLQNLLPTIEIPQTQTAVWILSVRPPQITNIYRVEIDGHEFRPSGSTHTQVGEQLRDSINLHFGETIATWNLPDITLSIPADGRSLRVRVEDPVNYNGIVITNNSYSHAGAIQANFLNFVSASLANPRADVSFGLLHNADLYEGKNTDFSGWVNFAQSENGNTYWQVGKSDPTLAVENFAHTYVPFVRVSYIFQKIADYLGVPSATGLFDEWQELSTLVVYNNYTLDAVQQDYELYELKFVNTHAKIIDLKNHVPDMTAREFLSDFCETFNLWWQVENGQLVFRKKVNILRGPSLINWGSFIVPNSIERGYKTANGLTLRLAEDETDKATSTGLNPYIEGNGGEDIALPTGALPEKEIQTGRTTCFSKQVRSDSVGTLRFMFDRGATDDGQGFRFQQLTCSELGGKLSILPTALWVWAWKESGEYRAYGWTLTATFELPMSDLNKVLAWDNCLRRIDTPFGSVVAAIKTVDVTEKVDGSTTTKVEFWVKN